MKTLAEIDAKIAGYTITPERAAMLDKLALPALAIITCNRAGGADFPSFKKREAWDVVKVNPGRAPIGRTFTLRNKKTTRLLSVTESVLRSSFNAKRFLSSPEARA